MNRFLTNLLICAAAFGGAYAMAHSSGKTGTPVDSAGHSEGTSGHARPSAAEIRHQTAVADMKTLVDHRGTERDEHVEAMTGPQINGCLDELFASNRLDEDAYATGNRLLSAWISLEPQAAFHWCQAHYFEFAAGLTTDLFQHIAADDPAQAEAFCAQLKTSALRKEALTGIAEAARPGEESRTLDHLLAFGTPGEEAAGRWIVELADNRPEEVTSLKAMIRAKKQTSAKWRSATLTRLKTVPTVDDFDLSGSGK